MNKKILYLIPFIAILITACHTNKTHSSVPINSDGLTDSSFISSIDSSSLESISSDSSFIASSDNSISSSDEEIEDEIINIELFALNDTHGNVVDSTSGLGISKTATLLKTYPKNVDNALYISQGDMWQGQAESGLTFGKIVNDWMSQMHFASMTVGNHEFDWNTSYVKANAESASFPYLGINVYSRATNQRVDYLKPSVVVEKNGAKIGIIGAIGDCYSSISYSMVKDIYFKVENELTSLVKNEAIRLRNEENCDFIIYSVHDGMDDDDNNPYNTALSSYVDLVLEGHTHLDYHYLDSRGIYHVQSAGYNSTINYVDIDINITQKTSSIKSIKSIKTNDYTSLLKDEETETLFTKYDSVIGHVHDVIGYNASKRYSSSLHQKTADLYLDLGLEKWNEYQIFLGGGFVKTRSPYNLERGNVTYAHLYSLFPFNNNVILCSISGYNLKNRFINTPKDYYVSYSSYGSLHKDEIDDYATYYIVTDTYSSDYSKNGLTIVERYLETGYYTRDAFKDYIAAGNYA